MKKVVTFGEIMMRLNPPGYQRLLQTVSLEVSYAGGEANVAVSLANLGHKASFVSAVPNNPLGQAAINAVRRYGVDTERVIRTGNRLGTYYVEKGASQRASKVIYDRANSSITQSKSGDYPWDEIFADTDWFHFTGITPALGGDLPEICRESCIAAKAHGVKVSCDLNYRNKLWTRDQARTVMTELMPYVDVLIANEEDAHDVFGIAAENTDVSSGQLDRQAYISVAKQLSERFKIPEVAITLRKSISANVNEWSGMLYTQGSAWFSTNYSINIVDRVGGGDSFGGALICAMLEQRDPQYTIDFAVAASCLKHTMEQDFNLITRDEVLSLMAGNASGRVQR